MAHKILILILLLLSACGAKNPTESSGSAHIMFEMNSDSAKTPEELHRQFLNYDFNQLLELEVQYSFELQNIHSLESVMCRRGVVACMTYLQIHLAKIEEYLILLEVIKLRSNDEKIQSEVSVKVTKIELEKQNILTMINILK